MRCPHCGRELVAERTGEGVRVSYGKEPAFVLASPCPYPQCARPLFARATTERDRKVPLVLMTMAEVVRWSPAALFALACEWPWPCALLLGFALIPAWGIHSAVDSLRCGGMGFFFFLAGSLLALVPVIFFFRGLAVAAEDEVRLAFRSRAMLRAGGAGGLKLSPTPATYRCH